MFSDLKSVHSNQGIQGSSVVAIQQKNIYVFSRKDSIIVQYFDTEAGLSHQWSVVYRDQYLVCCSQVSVAVWTSATIQQEAY